MTDGVTPRCLLCGEHVELADHMERLDANQQLIEWRTEKASALAFKVAAVCKSCREDPERCCLMVRRLSRRSWPMSRRSRRGP